MPSQVNLEEIINAASYERVSSDEQAKEGFSLEVQNEKNVDYIKSQSWNFVGSYIDPGKSGKNLNRPDMKRMLADIEKRKINAVVVHKLDRLTRNVGDLHSLLTLFDQKEIKLVSISENIDTSTAMGRMFVYMLGIFAQWYRENLSEEVYKGSIKRAEKGFRMTGSVPYGYKANEDLSLEINESEARVVRQIFEWYVKGYGKHKIANILNREGIEGTPIPSPKKGGIWRDAVIKTLLANWSYIGATHWKKKGDPEEKRIIIRDRHEPVISEELFLKAQHIAGRKQERSMSRSGYDFPFSTILKCGDCGRGHSGSQRYDKGKAYRYYICRGKKYNECSAPVISENKVNALFLEFIQQLFTFDAPHPHKRLGERNPEKEIKRLTRLISESRKAKMNYTRAMGSGKLEYAIYEQLMDEEEKKLQKWQKELDELQQYSPTTTRTRRDILNDLQNLSQSWGNMAFESRKVMVQSLFEALVIKNTGSEWSLVGYKIAD